MKLPKLLKIPKTIKNPRDFIFVGLFLVSTGIFIFLYTRSKATQPIDTGGVRETKQGNIITSDFAVIPTEIVPDRKKTVITIPFKPPKERTEVWLSLRLNNEKIVSSLMSHPDLNTLSWEYVGNDRYTLFQKQKLYQSIEEFISNPPPNAKIQADPDIIREGLLSGDNVTELASLIDTNTLDYILTTYKPHYMENEWNVFKSIFDASDAYIDKETMFWTLTMKGVSPSNPFIFKWVYVDYLQPPGQNNVQQMRIQ